MIPRHNDWNILDSIVMSKGLHRKVTSQNARLISNWSNRFIDGGSNKTTRDAMLKIIPSPDVMPARTPSNNMLQILASSGIPHVSGYILEIHSSSVVESIAYSNFVSFCQRLLLNYGTKVLAMYLESYLNSDDQNLRAFIELYAS